MPLLGLGTLRQSFAPTSAAPTARLTFIAVLVTLALTGPTASALAASPPAGADGQWLSTADIATHLAENGFHVLALTMEPDGYEADLIDRQGNRVEAHLHPVTAELLRTKAEGRAGPMHEQWLTLPQVARHLETTGFTVRKIETGSAAYEVDLADRTGTRTEAEINPATGVLFSSKAR